MPAGHSLFAYGTLMFEDVLAAVLGRALPSSAGHIEGFARFVVAGRAADAAAARVGGEVVDVGLEALGGDRRDRGFEPLGLRRARARVAAGGEEEGGAGDDVCSHAKMIVD